MVVADVLHDLVGAGADGGIVEEDRGVAADLFKVLAAPHGNDAELAQSAAVQLGEGDVDGVVVDDLDVLEINEGHIGGVFEEAEGEGDVLRGEVVAVLELDTFAQLEGDAEVVVVQDVLGGEALVADAVLSGIAVAVVVKQVVGAHAHEHGRVVADGFSGVDVAVVAVGDQVQGVLGGGAFGKSGHAERSHKRQDQAHAENGFQGFLRHLLFLLFKLQTFPACYSHDFAHTSPAKWQATMWPGAVSLRSGDCWRQISVA